MKQNLRRLGDLDSFEVASDDADVRGWSVKTRDGRAIGEVEELIVDPAAQKVRYLEVDLDREGFGLRDARRVSIPVESAEVSQRDHTVLINGLSRDAIAALPESEYRTASGGREDMAGRASSRRETAIPRAEEELHVGKRSAEVGEVVVGKHIETEHVREPVTVERERVHVDRRPATGDLRGREHRMEDEEIRVPVVEEELVVEKRPVIKEEIVVSKDTVRDVKHVEDDLRKERFDVRKEGRVIEDTDPKTRGRGGR